MPFDDRYQEFGLNRNPFIARSSVDEKPRTFVDHTSTCASSVRDLDSTSSRTDSSPLMRRRSRPSCNEGSPRRRWVRLPSNFPPPRSRGSSKHHRETPAGPRWLPTSSSRRESAGSASGGRPRRPRRPSLDMVGPTRRSAEPRASRESRCRSRVAASSLAQPPRDTAPPAGYQDASP